jgi:hypothetical protein
MVAHASAFACAARRKEFADFIEREAKLLGMFDEPHTLHCVWCKKSESSFRAWSGRQESPALVVAHGVNAHASAQCDLSDAER